MFVEEAAKLPPAAHVQAMELGDLQKLAVEGSAAPAAASPAAAASSQHDAAVRGVVASAVEDVFVVAVGVAGLAFLLVLLIPVLPLEHRGRRPVPTEEPMPTVPEIEGL